MVLFLSQSQKAMEQEVHTRKIPKTSPYGNYVFAYLSKLYHFSLLLSFSGVCEWNQQSIIVDGDVIISPPYGVSEVSGENAEHVNEVKERVSLFLKVEDLVTKYEVEQFRLLKQSLSCLSNPTISTIPFGTTVPFHHFPCSIGRLSSLAHSATKSRINHSPSRCLACFSPFLNRLFETRPKPSSSWAKRREPRDPERSQDTAERRPPSPIARSVSEAFCCPPERSLPQDSRWC